jgi:diguanylate cyclase (GGDEF)-like protein
MNNKQSKLFAEQVKILYENAPSVIPVNMIIGGILGLFLLPVLQIERIVTWWSVLVALSIVRYFHTKHYLNHANWLKVARTAHLQFVIYVFAMGCVWASAFFLFAFNVPDVYLVFIIFAIGGMSVGAIASMGTSKSAFFAFILPMNVPPIITFLFDGTALGYAMSAMLLIYLMSISLTYVQGYGRNLRNIEDTFVKDDLLLDLKVTNQNLELANEKIMVLSNTDDLTQLSNRRHFDLMYAKEWGRAHRFNVPLSFVMIDIDFFKDYNDHFGHQEGDLCLQKISNVLRSVMKRPGDLVSRYGGEEFAIILPDTNLEGAHILMLALQQSIHDLQIPSANTTVNPYVTVSMGIASIAPTDKDNPDELIAAADAQLYNAKHHGRNRIEQTQLSSV